MAAIIVTVVFLFWVITILWRYYQPTIEVVVFTNHYEVYLWYNKWEDSCLIGRVYKYLFKV